MRNQISGIKKDYESRPEAERANHIYQSVVTVREWHLRELNEDVGSSR
jgi:hypothetical protein